LPHVELVADAPEGATGNVVIVSRSRATDLVNAGMARRVLERAKAVSSGSAENKSVSSSRASKK